MKIKTILLKKIEKSIKFKGIFQHPISSNSSGN